jgi:adenylate cyclase
MADLIAQGEQPQDRWRRALPLGQKIVLGRTGGLGAVPWDPRISRQHAVLTWDGRRLLVARLEGGRNPIFFRGDESPQCHLAPGEHFVIGHTTFTLADERVQPTVDIPKPIQQQSYSSQYLKQVRFRNPDFRLETLSRIPEVISGAAGETELCVRLVSMLLSGLPRADAAAVVVAERRGDEPAGNAPAVRALHWDRRLTLGGDFQPSQRLILEAVRQQQSVLHVWEAGDAAGNQLFTSRGNCDWAFCTPVPGQSCPGWALYVAGRFDAPPAPLPGTSDPSDLREDLKFAELVASMLSSLRHMQLLNREHATLSQFFSPIVLGSLSHEDPEVALAPRETDVSVLFCDLRGFSLQTEQHSQRLLELLNRVSGALGVMTRHILDQGGVVGDFQGDAAMGFWGWPLAADDAVGRTCRAALAICRQFDAAAQDAASPLAGFHAGIGVATGRAVAGKIGTVDQVKVTVFGPVVNLASRLEGMTKILHAPILLDEATAAAVRREVPPDVARVRRLAVVRPYGLQTPLEVGELLPPAAEHPFLTDALLAVYEEALDLFLSGKWTAAYELLHRMPAQDRTADFLTVYIAQQNRCPPPHWDGVIPLANK